MRTVVIVRLAASLLHVGIMLDSVRLCTFVAVATALDIHLRANSRCLTSVREASVCTRAHVHGTTAPARLYHAVPRKMV